jgi:hypothetical protein
LATFYIDSVLKSTIYGANMTNNGNSWLWLEGIPYADNTSYSVGGTQQLYYAPNSIISGTTLPDRSADATTNNGTITYGSNQSISLHPGIMVSSNSTSSSTSNSSIGFTMPIATLPTNWFAPNDLTQLQNLPFYDEFHSAALQSGMSTQMIYFIIYIGIGFLIMLLVMRMTRSNLMGIIAFNSFLFIGTTNSIVPGWIAFSCLIVQFGILYLSRQV